ncbi:MAG: TldD/PmbA family protein [Candidatus Thorarchaeota archaeon]
MLHVARSARVENSNVILALSLTTPYRQSLSADARSPEQGLGGESTIDLLNHCVEKGESLGAEFVIARHEDLTLRTISRHDEHWKNIMSKSRNGIGVSCYVDGVLGYSFTAITDRENIDSAVATAVKMAKVSSETSTMRLPLAEMPQRREHRHRILSPRMHPSEVDQSSKMDLVQRVTDTARSIVPDAKNIRGMYGELYGTKTVVNSDRSEISWEFLICDLRVSIVARSDSGNAVVAFEGSGGTFGLEHFQIKDKTPEAIGTLAGETIVGQKKARMCPAGRFRALIESRLCGVLAHESFGHLSEADFVVTGLSPLTGKTGQRLGTEHATIVDTGMPDVEKYGGLIVPFDDQGTPATRTVVLQNGVLNHYLHDRGTARALGQSPTGNARAVDFSFAPIVRMTNTYFEPGDLTHDEAMELLKTGVYAIGSYGGQVEGDGSFLFKALRGYWVEHGEIQYPILEVSLSGNILELLGRVEGATRDLRLWSGYFGGCGKHAQSPLPVGSGGPELLMDGVTFGGKAQ